MDSSRCHIRSGTLHGLVHLAQAATVRGYTPGATLVFIPPLHLPPASHQRYSTQRSPRSAVDGVAVEEGADAGIGKPAQFLRRERNRPMVSAGCNVPGNKLDQVDSGQIGVSNGEMPGLRDPAQMIGDLLAHA